MGELMGGQGANAPSTPSCLPGSVPDSGHGSGGGSGSGNGNCSTDGNGDGDVDGSGANSGKPISSGGALSPAVLSSSNILATPVKTSPTNPEMSPAPSPYRRMSESGGLTGFMTNLIGLTQSSSISNGEQGTSPSPRRRHCPIFLLKICFSGLP